jgi:hypothetical protein
MEVFRKDQTGWGRTVPVGCRGSGELKGGASRCRRFDGSGRTGRGRQRAGADGLEGADGEQCKGAGERHDMAGAGGRLSMVLSYPA